MPGALFVGAGLCVLVLLAALLCAVFCTCALKAGCFDALSVLFSCGAPIAFGAATTLAGLAELAVALFIDGRYILTLFPLTEAAPGLVF